MNRLYKKWWLEIPRNISCQKNSSISQVNILADWRKYTGFKILSNISEMLWHLANEKNNNNKKKKNKHTNNPSNLFKLNMVHDSSSTG